MSYREHSYAYSPLRHLWLFAILAIGGCQTQGPAPELDEQEIVTGTNVADIVAAAERSSGRRSAELYLDAAREYFAIGDLNTVRDLIIVLRTPTGDGTTLGSLLGRAEAFEYGQLEENTALLQANLSARALS
ncbi:MAG: hypothetical protein O7H39_04990, partial [Gammaproteobacteria bacterium]|nr:hypothetical protein [Gammaproteobacteria bacterium]